MRQLLKKILQHVLRFFAVAILKKYSPEIVAVTGSVGKTSTAEAISVVLSQRFVVRRNIKNYNNEFGIPLSIIGKETGGHSVFRWAFVFLKAISLLFIRDRSYPTMLVLEMGADRPGDIEYLTSFVPITVSVVTAVAEAHLEYFKTIEHIAKEKGMLVRSLPRQGCAVLNFDDQRVRQMAQITKAQVITYGMLEGADVQASDIGVSHEVQYQDISTIQGISFKVKHGGNTVPVLLPKVLGEHLAYSALAAIAVGLRYKINLHDSANQLKQFEPPKGRMHLLPGVKNTLIIDDTYNASPLSTGKALYQLSQLSFNDFHRKFAILGDMLELGPMSEQAHRDVGEAVARYSVDYLVTVGERSRDIVRGAVEAGIAQDHCFNFPDSVQAGKFVQDKIAEGDIILIKGSQGVRMERIVKEIMAEPDRAAELLVRQDASWQ